MKKVLAGIAILAVAAVAQAELLASWQFSGTNSSAWGDAAKNGLDADDMSVNLSSATLSTEKFTASSSANNLRQNGTSWGTVGETADTLAADRGSYLGVTLQAKDNFTMTVNQIVMSTAGSGTGINGYAAWSDGTKLVTDAFQTKNETDKTLALSTPISGSTVSLRLVASLTTGGGTWGLAGTGTDNTSLTINGSTAAATNVPEPATMSLLGLGALAMVVRRKLSK